MMTLTSNLEQRMVDIPWKDLPKTFHEAITVCRALMIPYLWIDSICIIQDSSKDWETQSSKMHTIYHESTITLAALDAANSLKGLFLPKRSFKDVFPLPASFGDGKGQAFVGLPSWDAFTHSPLPAPDYKQHARQQMQNLFSQTSYVQSGLLETRAWVMQEMRLSARVLYFFKGEVMWRCTEAIWRQNGCRQSSKGMYHLRDALKKYDKAFEVARRIYSTMTGLQSPSIDNQEPESACVGSFVYEDDINEQQETRDESDLDRNETRFREIKLNDEASHSSSEVSEAADLTVSHGKAITRKTRITSSPDEVYTLVDVEMIKALHGIVVICSEGNNIQNTWYNIVGDYSSCQLTFAKDKLPALSGMASRFHSITKDDYLAGHWRIDLVQSLFWFSGPGASRVKAYRAPTWSWASIDGVLLLHTFYEIDREDVPLMELLDVRVQVVGENPFGEVSFGELIVRASTLKARWNSDLRTWTTSCSRNHSGNWRSKHELTVLDCDSHLLASWSYDDRLYGMWPGSLLTPESTGSDVEASLIYEYHEAAGDRNSLWSVATHAPEDLLLVRGPMSEVDAYLDYVEKSEEVGKERYQILVLKRTHDSENEYQRVGRGEMTFWDDDFATIQTLKII